MSDAPKGHPAVQELISRRTIAAAALGTSAFASAAVRSGAGGSGSDSAAADGSTDTVRGVDAGGSDVAASSASPVASDFTTLAARHRDMLTGGDGFAPGDAPYAGLHDNLDAQVAKYLASLDTSGNRTYLWNDQASGIGSANMTASFSRLRTMAIRFGNARVVLSR